VFSYGQATGRNFKYFHRCSTLKTLAILSCSAKKLDHPAPAKDLYQGTLFKKCRELCEKRGWDYIILSAKHGIVFPEQVLCPYDKKLENMADARELFHKIYDKIWYIIGEYDEVYIIAGKFYTEFYYSNGVGEDHYKCNFIRDERGIGGLIQKINEMINSGKSL
jgi:hypothetical protein